jgi:predicted acetyltransferase
MDFAEYFDAEGIHPFFIRVDGAIAGFVVVGRLPETAGWNMEQFFVLARFQRQGVGLETAAEVWRRFPGPWRVEVIPENRRAYLFWKSVIDRATGDTYREAVEDSIYDGERKQRIVIRFTAGR